MQLRFYDERGHDWHQWDDDEARAYRRFMEENHRPFVEFSVGGPALQLEYWNWRHTHPNIDDRDVNRYRDDHDNDYHQWNADEDRAYRRWLAENNRPFIVFNRRRRCAGTVLGVAAHPSGLPRHFTIPSGAFKCSGTTMKTARTAAT